VGTQWISYDEDSIEAQDLTREIKTGRKAELLDAVKLKWLDAWKTYRDNHVR
jgi:hypothetical protein